MNPILFLSYINGTVAFLLVLFAGEYIFCLSYKRKDHFPLRFFLSEAGVIAVSILPTLLYYYIGSTLNDIVITNLFVIFLYLIMFALSVAAMKLCYDVSVLSCLMGGVAGYSCQHIFYCLYSIINFRTFMEIPIYRALGGIAGGYICQLLQLVFAAVVLIAIYFLFAKKAMAFSPDGIMRGNAVFISVATLTLVLIINAFCNIFASESRALDIVCKCLLIICGIFILLLRTGMFESVKLKNDIVALSELHEKERRNYERLKENMELINIKCHDIKHYISTVDMKKGIDTDELNELVKMYDTNVKTGNDTIDTILTERNLYCTAHNIRTTVIADASLFDFMDVTDICSLFGNMLENAIEATEKICDESKRIINVIIRPIANRLFICVENYFEERPVFRDGLPVSRKDDGNYHGFGMKSIKMITEKYDGVLSNGVDGEIFRISILFPLCENHDK